MRRSLLLVAVVALAARWSVAILTESRPIFPDYYYADAKLYDSEAAYYAAAISSGTSLMYRLTPGRELYTWWVTLFYLGFGRHPLLLKLINGLFGASSVLLLGLLAARLWPNARAGPVAAPPPSAGDALPLVRLGPGLLLAFWPTHLFYSSQNTKEAMMLLVLAASFWLFLAGNAESDRKPGLTASEFRPLLGTAALLLMGLLRSHLLPMASAALLLAAAWRAAASRGHRWALARAGRDAACVLAALALFGPVSSRTIARWTYEERHMPFVKGIIDARPSLDAEAAKDPQGWSPAWITNLRRMRQERDQQYAQKTFKREVRSQIFQGVEFKTWLDVAVFLPKGAFTVLFMPLPGFYPMEGSLGRMLACLENLAILALCLLAFIGVWRHGRSPERAALAAFFLILWMASALTEVDLGSATRHRLQYLPFLLPFAFWRL
ncbi:MAG: hypothetical protein HZB91_05610 [Elusimicrobia bacterium]|nr:hypothetical protein [Elusimicrobiota bacterium]